MNVLVRIIAKTTGRRCIHATTGRRSVEQRVVGTNVYKCFNCGSTEHLSGDCHKIRCYRCGGHGHAQSLCFSPRKCYICGDPGHISHACPSRPPGMTRPPRGVWPPLEKGSRYSVHATTPSHASHTPVLPAGTPPPPSPAFIARLERALTHTRSTRNYTSKYAAHALARILQTHELVQPDGAAPRWQPTGGWWAGQERSVPVLRRHLVNMRVGRRRRLRVAGRKRARKRVAVESVRAVMRRRAARKKVFWRLKF